MMYQAAALQQVITQTVMLNDAKKHVGVSGGEVDQAVGKIMEANKIKDTETLKRALAQNGLNYDDFREMIKNDIYLAKMSDKIKSGVTISADDLREVRARHILIAFKAPGHERR